MRLALARLRLSKLRPRKVLNFILRKLGLRAKASTALVTSQDGLVSGVDRLLVLNGFGAFASGWLLSPRQRVLGLSLLFGGKELAGDRRCLSAIPRRDLAAPFAEYSDLVSTAGFHTVFRGEASESWLGIPALRVLLDDGTSPILKASDKVVRPCDTFEALCAVAELFPSLPNEPFLDAFVASFEATVRKRAGQAVLIAAAEAADVVVIVLPRQFDDIFLAFAEIRRSLGALPPDVGIVFVTNRLHRRTQVVNRFGVMQRSSRRPLSLFDIGDPTYALWSLAPILNRLGAGRFCFFGPDVVATESGWRAIASYFADGRSGLEIFLRREDRGGIEAESLSFAWSTSAFAPWAGSAPFFLGGFYRDNHLPSDPAPARIAGAISLLHTTVEVEAIRQVDELRYRMGPAHDRIEANT